jgi:hypothetical protein
LNYSLSNCGIWIGWRVWNARQRFSIDFLPWMVTKFAVECCAKRCMMAQDHRRQFLAQRAVLAKMITNFYSFRSLLVVGLAVFLAHVTAQSQAQGLLGTENCKPIGENASIDVVPENDSVLDVGIKNDFAVALGARGHRTESNALVRFLYRTEIRQLKKITERSGLVDSKGSTVSGQEVLVHLWRSNENSVLGGKRGGRARADYATYLLLIVEVADNRDGSCIWRGRAMARLEGWRKSELAKRLIPPLVSKLGETVIHEDIILE